MRSVFDRAANETKRMGPRTLSNLGDSSIPEPSRPKKMKMSLAGYASVKQGQCKTRGRTHHSLMRVTE